MERMGRLYVDGVPFAVGKVERGIDDKTNCPIFPRNQHELAVRMRFRRSFTGCLEVTLACDGQVGCFLEIKY